MGVNILAFLAAALSGVTMAVQGSINAVLGKFIGLLETTFVVHLAGLVFITVMLVILRWSSPCNGFLGGAPWYAYLGGILGVLIIYGVAHSIPKVGVAPATTAIIMGQLITAGVIDHFGLFGLDKLPFNWCRMAGILAMTGGAWLLLRK